jgi:hypothetical protein
MAKGPKRRNIGLPLAKVITTVIDEMVGQDGVLSHAAAQRAYALLLPRERRALVEQSLWAHLKAAMRRSRESIEKAGGERQGCLAHFGLIPAVAFDDQVKKTNKLIQFEFRRAIDIREKQLAGDTETLNAMRRAYAAVKPDWDTNPALTRGFRTLPQAHGRVTGRDVYQPRAGEECWPTRLRHGGATSRSSARLRRPGSDADRVAPDKAGVQYRPSAPP